MDAPGYITLPYYHNHQRAHQRSLVPLIIDLISFVWPAKSVSEGVTRESNLE